MGTTRHELVFFYPEGHEAHFEQGHPERPERVEAISCALDEIGWWETYPHLEPLVVSQDLLRSVHDSTYLKQLEASCRSGLRLDMDTYTTTASWALALNAIGGALAVAHSVWEGKARRGFAITRPPGHHATINRGMGFCLLNNVALVAEYLFQEAGAKRLAVIDLDLHHGNGTQDIFWERGELFYISTHQFPYYPGTGDVNDIGSGPGEGTTANFTLPPGSGDQAFHEIMGELILPLVNRFNPDMVLVSFGFDPHWRDPLGHLQLSADGYRSLVASLTGWADENCSGRIALFLEGGYDLEAGAACGQAVVAALLGREWQDTLGPSPYPEENSWQVMKRQALEIWEL